MHAASRPVEGGSFPGSRDVLGAPPSLKNTENDVPDGFFLTSNMHKIHFRPRTPLEKLTTLPQTPSIVREYVFNVFLKILKTRLFTFFFEAAFQKKRKKT